MEKLKKKIDYLHCNVQTHILPFLVISNKNNHIVPIHVTLELNKIVVTVYYVF